MTRRDQVRAYVEEHYQDSVPPGELPGVDAIKVAKALSIQRSDASADLNTLYRMGVLDKLGKKPVKFLPAGKTQAAVAAARPQPSAVSISEDACPSQSIKRASKEKYTAFCGVIGANGSISAQIQLAKAAVSYPPNGLHTLIIGESGVGKSLLAEEMWRYGKETGAFDSSGKGSPPFVLFSCADYADNPQLLLSQLFGHAKGSFSGATENKPGLVERAEGGVLFLDEIHRLPPAGQELLFTLLDKNVYRRLGETTERRSNLMIISATTEYPSGVLLTTFMRRIPVIIQLPNLSERPPNERLELIKHFLTLEANRLGLPIRVSGRVMQILISYECKANIGSLKNDIKLACAKSYLSYLSSVDTEKKAMLSINIQDLPQKVYSAVPNPELLNKKPGKALTVQLAGSGDDGDIPDACEIPVDLYGFVQKRLDAYKYFSLPQEDLESTIGRELERYYYAATESLLNPDDNTLVDRPGIVTPAIWTVANEIMKEASHSLGRNYSQRLNVALAMHIQQFVGRMKSGQIIYNPNLPYIKTQYPAELDVINAMMPAITHHLGVNVTEDEAGFLAMFLTQQLDTEKQSKVGLVVATNGREVASGIAEVANRLFASNHIRAIDVPLSWSLPDIFKQLCQTVQEADQGKGVLILGDIDSLVFMEDDIQEKTGVLCRIIPGASISLVLEASKLVLISDAALDDVADIVVDNYKDYANFICNTMVQKKNELPEAIESGPPRDSGTRDVILTVSYSGIGAAAKVRKMLLDSLPITRSMDIIPVGMPEEVGAITQKLKSRLRLVIGSVDPKLEGVPFIELSKVLTNQGLSEIEMILLGWAAMKTPPQSLEKELSREEMLSLINSQVQRFAPSLDADKLIRNCSYILREIESRIYHQPLPPAVIARVYLHTVCMFDRLVNGDTLPLSEATELIKRDRREEFNLLYSITTSAAYRLDIHMLESEVCYLLITLPEKGELEPEP